MTIDEVIKSVATIPSYILDDDIRLYHKYASQLEVGSIILDVGTGLGKSAIALALSNPEAQVLTYDAGDFPLDRGWVKSKDQYRDMIKDEQRLRNVVNIDFKIKNVLTETFLPDISLFHLDGEKIVETIVLKYIFPRLKKDSIMLIRNYDRFKEDVDAICKGCQFLENRGKIQVIRKI